jgi:hypothetical protein
MFLSVNEIRKAIKPMGYTLVKSGAVFGKEAYTYKHLESGDKLTYNVFTQELLKRWKPLFDWQDEHAGALRDFQRQVGFSGAVGIAPSPKNRRVGMVIPVEGVCSGD